MPGLLSLSFRATVQSELRPANWSSAFAKEAGTAPNFALMFEGDVDCLGIRTSNYLHRTELLDGACSFHRSCLPQFTSEPVGLEFGTAVVEAQHDLRIQEILGQQLDDSSLFQRYAPGNSVFEPGCGTMHIILAVTDHGTPRLTRDARVVVNVIK